MNYYHIKKKNTTREEADAIIRLLEDGPLRDHRYFEEDETLYLECRGIPEELQQFGEYEDYTFEDEFEHFYRLIDEGGIEI